jgi:hypothetical protein
MSAMSTPAPTQRVDHLKDIPGADSRQPIPALLAGEVTLLVAIDFFTAEARAKTSC